MKVEGYSSDPGRSGDLRIVFQSLPSSVGIPVKPGNQKMRDFFLRLSLRRSLRRVVSRATFGTLVQQQRLRTKQQRRGREQIFVACGLLWHTVSSLPNVSRHFHYPVIIDASGVGCCDRAGATATAAAAVAPVPTAVAPACQAWQIRNFGISLRVSSGQMLR